MSKGSRLKELTNHLPGLPQWMKRNGGGTGEAENGSDGQYVPLVDHVGPSNRKHGAKKKEGGKGAAMVTSNTLGDEGECVHVRVCMSVCACACVCARKSVDVSTDGIACDGFLSKIMHLNQNSITPVQMFVIPPAKIGNAKFWPTTGVCKSVQAASCARPLMLKS